MINRLIATLLIRNGVVVQTNKFNPTNYIGNAIIAVDFFNSWAVDEICILEISQNKDYLEKFYSIVDELSKRCFVPLSVGGKINSIEDANKYFKIGADKVCINTGGFNNKHLIKSLSNEFGSQAIVMSVDVYCDKKFPSKYGIATNSGKKKQNRDAVEWITESIENGAGEIFLNSIEHDGNRNGYNIEFIKMIRSTIKVPIVAMGGVGEWIHLVEGVNAGAQSVAAGNIFHFTEHSTKKAKEFMIKSGIEMRPTYFYQLNTSRKVRDILHPISNKQAK